MPPVSEKQRKAMAAAAGGNSTLGIPKTVGAEYMAADPGEQLPRSAPSSAPSPKPSPKRSQPKHLKYVMPGKK
jgi:hypothetical protein